MRALRYQFVTYVTRTRTIKDDSFSIFDLDRCDSTLCRVTVAKKLWLKDLQSVRQELEG